MTGQRYISVSEKQRPDYCAVCGHLLPKRRKGRPREHHDSCGTYLKLMGWLEDTLMELTLTPEKAKKIRSRIWSAGNLVNDRLTKPEDLYVVISNEKLAEWQEAAERKG